MFFRKKLTGMRISLPEDLEEIIRKKFKVEEKVLCDSITRKQYENSLEAEIDEEIEKVKKEITEKIEQIEHKETFPKLLFKFIDSKALTDKEVYKKAYIDRRLFSKIRCDESYEPYVGTITLLGLALELTIEEFEALLGTVNYALLENSVENIVIRYLFEQKIYNIQKANNIFYTLCRIVISEYKGWKDDVKNEYVWWFWIE